MIALIEGEVRDVREASVVVQAGAFGIEAFAPASTLSRCVKGSFVTLHTHFLVREEQPVLYGFHEADQLLVFRRLLEVGGVGPKVALGVLSTLTPALIAAAVDNGDAGLLTSAPGVGKRTAERIVLELKGRLPEELLAGTGPVATRASRLVAPAAQDAIDALLALGYREGQVRGLVAELAAKEPDESAESLIRRALARLR